MAGRFDKVNDTFLNNFARVDTVSPALDPTFTLNTNNEVRFLVAESTRLTYAGTFTQTNTISRSRIAQADPPYVSPGDITSFDPSPNGVVNNLVSAGELYVVGEFTTIAGQSRPAGVASFVSNAITSFSPDLQSFEGTSVAAAQAIYAYDGGVYVAGTFEKVAGVERLGLAKVSGTTGGLLTDFSANIAKLTTYSYFLEEGTFVRGMLGDGDLLLIYGTPRIINSVRRTFIAAFEEDGSLSDYNVEISLNAVNAYDTSLDTNGDVYFSMACYESGITVNGQERRGGAATDSDGNLLPWNPNVSIFGADVYSLCVRGNFVYIGGFLWEVSGDSSYEYFAATLKSTGGLVALADNPSPDGAVQTIAATDTFIYIGGWFDQVRDNLGTPVAVNGFAILSASGGTYQTDLGVSGDIGAGDTYVNSIELNQDETLLYMAGYFTTVQGQTRQGLFSINTSHVLQSWTSSLFDLGAQTLSIAYDQQTIIVAGYSQQDSITAIRLAELDLNGNVTELNTLSAKNAHQNIWSVEKTESYLYAFGWVLYLINTELDPIAFPTFFFTNFNVFPGGQACEQIGRYQIITALNLVGSVEGTTGRYQPIASGDFGTDSSGTPLLGATGLAGITGLSGPTGAYLYGATGSVIRGATGLTGPTGLRGLTGLRGETGIAPPGMVVQGETGIQGLTGVIGFEQIDYYYTDGNTNPTTINLTAAQTIIAIDTIESPVQPTIVLPLAASVGPGKYYVIADVGIGYGPGVVGFYNQPITVQTSGSDTINGASSIVLRGFKDTAYIVSNGVDRYTISIPRSIGMRGATGILQGSTGIAGITGVEFV